jgi:hypothetical protein
MCRETVGIALCAPLTSPHLSYTCGKLHNIAAFRETCDSIKGNCPCFFGTCGRIDTIATSNAVDFAAIRKVRCQDCTKREDETGCRREGKDLADSPLLNRLPVPEECMSIQMDVLKKLWKGATECNIDHQHLQSLPVGEQVAANGDHHSDGHASVNKSRSNSRTSEKSIKEITSHLKTSGLAPHLGIQSSRWAENADAPKLDTTTSPKENLSRVNSVKSIHSTNSQHGTEGAHETGAPETEPAETVETAAIDSVFTLKNLPETLPDFAAMKAFLVRG